MPTQGNDGWTHYSWKEIIGFCADIILGWLRKHPLIFIGALAVSAGAVAFVAGYTVSSFAG